jgi:hypothetical protein
LTGFLIDKQQADYFIKRLVGCDKEPDMGGYRVMGFSVYREL